MKINVIDQSTVKLNLACDKCRKTLAVVATDNHKALSSIKSTTCTGCSDAHDIYKSNVEKLKNNERIRK